MPPATPSRGRPSAAARWFLRRRLNRMIDEVNIRLELQIPPFQQTKRRVLIDQLSYDPEIMQAIDAEAQATGTPREVLSRQVERYAREIVPSFNAWAYFRIGYHVARRAVETLYRVRLGYSDDEALARYVQAATVGGVVQTVYPKGGLNRDGRLHKPKLGLINYMVSSFDPEGARDLVFVPVGINYDRVLEDRMLARAPKPGEPRRSRARVLATALRFAAHNVGLMIRRRWYRFGYACVNFAAPISMRDYAKANEIDFRTLEPEARFEAVETLGGELLQAIARAIPVLPVSPVATVFVRAGDEVLGLLEIKALIDALEREDAYVHVPRADRDYAITVGLRMLTLRHFVSEADGLFRANAGERDMLRYYANAIEHFLPEQGEGEAGRDPAPATAAAGAA